MTVKETQLLIRQNLAMYRIGEKTFTEDQAAVQLTIWAAALKDVPAQAGFYAMQQAFTVCRFPVTLADLMAQLRAMQEANEPSFGELWCWLVKTAKKAASTAQEYTFTARTPAGITQGEAARDKNRERWEHLHPAAQSWLGNVSELIRLGQQNDTALQFRRAEFERIYNEHKAQTPLSISALERYCTPLPGNTAPALHE